MDKLYKHHKGGLYVLLSFGYLEENKKHMAIYKSVETEVIWVRPYSEFREKFILIGTV